MTAQNKSNDLISFQFDKKKVNIIKVIGVGGGGGNAVNHMFKLGIHNVDFVVCNTDSQALANSPVPVKVQLGASLTEGRGAGNKPETGRDAAIENLEDVKSVLQPDTKMVFITAGMGGGTGTGGAPVIAKLCQELGFLTVGIVTIPFRNEGKRRIRQAVEGIQEMERHVDSLLVINNERIREMYGDFPISQAFAKADDVLAIAAKGIAEIITVPGYVNVDFADVETVMRQSGVAVMGTGLAEGDGRSITAIEKALASPLLNNNDIKGAKNILLHITSGDAEITMDEIGEITDFIQNKAGFEADLIWGNGIDSNLGNQISVTVIATGFNSTAIPELMTMPKNSKETHHLTDFSQPVQPKVSVRTEVNNKPAEKQQSIKFDLSFNAAPKNDYDLLYSNSSKEGSEKKQDDRFKVDFSHFHEDDLDQLEDVPAYIRKQMRPNQQVQPKKSDYSKYSVVPDAEKKVVIRSQNLFLNPNVD
jgi:cell division protein FtsZ